MKINRRIKREEKEKVYFKKSREITMFKRLHQSSNSDVVRIRFYIFFRMFVKNGVSYKEYVVLYWRNPEKRLLKDDHTMY